MLANRPQLAGSVRMPNPNPCSSAASQVETRLPCPHARSSKSSATATKKAMFLGRSARRADQIRARIVPSRGRPTNNSIPHRTCRNKTNEYPLIGLSLRLPVNRREQPDIELTARGNLPRLPRADMGARWTRLRHTVRAGGQEVSKAAPFANTRGLGLRSHRAREDDCCVT